MSLFFKDEQTRIALICTNALKEHKIYIKNKALVLKNPGQRVKIFSDSMRNIDVFMEYVGTDINGLKEYRFVRNRYCGNIVVEQKSGTFIFQ